MQREGHDDRRQQNRRGDNRAVLLEKEDGARDELRLAPLPLETKAQEGIKIGGNQQDETCKGEAERFHHERRIRLLQFFAALAAIAAKGLPVAKRRILGPAGQAFEGWIGRHGFEGGRPQSSTSAPLAKLYFSTIGPFELINRYLELIIKPQLWYGLAARRFGLNESPVTPHFLA